MSYKNFREPAEAAPDPDKGRQVTDRRYDVKLSGGKVDIDVAPGHKKGILVQDPVYVFSKEDDIKPRKTLQQGDPEYLINKRAWFGSTDKARMFVTEYIYYDEEDNVEKQD